MITITINEKEISLEKPVTVIKAAKQAGIKIPTLCYHEALKPFGGCRLCVVEVERMPKLQTACTLMAADGMVITTESEEISKVRRGILEFLLINHPLDCPYCDKAGECELQDLVKKYGASAGRHTEAKRRVPESHKDMILSRNMERCVSCTRCVRMCRDVQGASAIDMMGRGNHTRMEPYSADSFNCEYCGNCLSACPVGAILSRQSLHSFRPWQIDREVETVCSFCGVGCSLVVQVRDDAVKRVVPQTDLGLNKGLLCARGRFGYDYTQSEERLTSPYIKKNGKLEKCTWSEALSLAASKLSKVKEEHGGSSIAGIASPRCSNEDNYVFQKFMRMACGTNNIDSVSRMGYAAAQHYFENLLGQGITANMIEGIRNAETIIVLGGDPTSINPILGLSVRDAARKGAKVLVLGYAKGLERFSTGQVVPELYKEAEVLEALLAEAFRAKGSRGEQHVIEQGIQAVADGVSGDPKLDGYEEMKNALISSQSTAVVFGMDLVQRSDGHRTLFAVAGLTYLLEARLYLLSEKNNEQGLIDAGCTPDMLPGSRPVNDFRTKFEDGWNGPVPSEEGRTLLEIFEGARDKSIKALYVMGENPVCSIPGGSSVTEALDNLDVLIVQDIFMTETAQMADVVLPALGWTEKAGTYTNVERRIQLQKKAVESAKGMDDWKILSHISGEMGYAMDYDSADDVMKEMARISPLYRDLSYAEISAGKSIWPYHGEPLRGEVNELPKADKVAKDFSSEYYLSVEKPLYHSGTLTRRAAGLVKIYPSPCLQVGEETARRLGVSDGDLVRFETALGAGEGAVAIDGTIQDNRVYFSNNFSGKAVMNLLPYTLDAITKAPGLEGCAVTIHKL